MGINKKGIFFSMDALIALAIILLSILVAYPIINSNPRQTFTQGDLILTLSTLKIGELNNSVASELILSGQISDLNKTLIEQIAQLYVSNETASKLLAESILNDIGTNENIGIWFGDKLLASKNSTSYSNARIITSETQKISGIKEGNSVTAFSGRAYLSNSLQSKYFYFGGYVGEGNITARVDYSGNISSAKMELAIEKNFSLYINNNFEGNYSGSGSQLTPVVYNIPIGNFSSGQNIIELKGNNLNLAGGFIKISYIPEVSYSSVKTQYLPGIKGVINLYDGFYVPGPINTLKIFLKFNNSVETFLNIGNTTVFNESTSGMENFTLNNTYLSNLLNYTNLISKTTPLRFGIANLSGLPGIGLKADIYSVSSVSGGMNSNVGGGGTPKKIDVSIAANADFVDRILNYLNGSRIGLVGYASGVATADYHNLSTNKTSLNATINGWKAGGSICVCCGINKAVSDLANYSNSSIFKSLVIMNDGTANAACAEQNTGNAEEDAVKAACDAYTNYSIRIYTIGFGSGGSYNATTLIRMAQCGKGSYYSTVDDLLSVYRQIAEEFLETIYAEQTLNYTSSNPSELSSDSYIEFDYNQTSLPYGLITTVEKRFDNENGGTFILPSNSTVLDASVISYSGKKWTGLISINGVNFYNLSNYSGDLIKLGDPYSINIPLNLINTSNVVNVSTTSSIGNYSNGSSYNKIIYTILQKNITAYSSLSNFANGCNWTIQFEDLNNISTNIPDTYFGTDRCYYTSSNRSISNSNDAFQSAVEKVLKLLDYDSDGMIDVAFNEQDLKISSAQISGIPFDWSTKMQVRVWS